MTLDEAIQHAQERAYQDCTECAKEHQQLADWLLELKRFRVNTKKSNKNDTKNKFAVYDYGKTLAIADTYKEAEKIQICIERAKEYEENLTPQYDYGLVKISPYGLTTIKELNIEEMCTRVEVFVQQEENEYTVRLSSRKVQKKGYNNKIVLSNNKISIYTDVELGDYNIKNIVYNMQEYLCDYIKQINNNAVFNKFKIIKGYKMYDDKLYIATYD